MENKRFVVTYGTSPEFPYESGYSIVYAKSRCEACELHAKKYGYTKDGCLRFAFIYTTEESEKWNCEVGELHSVLFPGVLFPQDWMD